MAWKCLLLTCSFLPVVFAAIQASAGEPVDTIAKQFEALTFQSDGHELPYRLLKPLNYDASKSYPLVVFLHGAGERGTDNKAQLVHVVSIFCKPENRRDFPCFVLVPQCPQDQQWVKTPWAASRGSQPKQPSWPMALVLQLINALEKENSIDSKRLYVMGISMGGYGTWDVVSRHPERFAAAVPICGGGDETKAAAIAAIPIWAFHGAKDDVVKPIRSRNMVAAMKKAGGQPKYTEYPDAGHDSWSQASAEKELLPWLFEQKRP